jgi:iron(III) transport system ATP-binding protein
VIALHDVSCRYGDVEAVAGVTLNIASGEMIAVVGPSGSGKSTLLRLIAGLEIPRSGEIRIDGELASSPQWLLDAHRRGIGMAFQQPSLWPHINVAGQIEFPIAHWPRSERQQRVQELLGVMQLEHKAGRKPSEVSGGEARRVALARALAAKPKRLLLDEPLVNIDPETRPCLLEYVLRSARETQASLIYVTHDGAEAAQFPGRVIRLSQGRILLENRPL